MHCCTQISANTGYPLLDWRSVALVRDQQRSPLELYTLQLQHRLGMLLANSHPFYTPRAFAGDLARCDGDLYERWRQYETQHIHQTLGALWLHRSLPTRCS
jgi:hypothetical protein